MIETSFFGVYVPGLLLLAGGAMALAWWLRRLLSLIGAYRWIWHPALFDLGLYIVVLHALVRLTGAISI
ncbi:DUF1656 domain-containing protein (plasmid) [Variovorax sp. 375MFSha3.1]|uniref:DUF1656 domain-containing protein n=1 Tax=Variovorax guangxiensis TaxID=1775474 RepID=A0A840FZM8_9BURK|nr:DUF1656 domain-containing protein [Variovorax guangxiensis]MBB4225695.1 hypothetical protein [Variovorax guangxiensis]